MLKFKDYFDFGGAIDVLRSEWHNLIDFSFEQIQYADMKGAIWAAVIVGLFVAIKILLVLFGKKKNVLIDSGILVNSDRKNQKRFLIRILSITPRIMLVVPLAMVILALADPFLFEVREEFKKVETRTRVEVKDISGSMTAHTQIQGVTRAQVAMEAHLEFLKMRKGKGDRVSLWVFSDSPFLIQDFILDDDAYYIQAHDAPWVTGGGFSSDPALPMWRQLVVNGQGGTELVPALKAVISQFDADEEVQRKSSRSSLGPRSLLLITDAEISDHATVDPLINDLINRRVKIYIIFVDAAVSGQSGAQSLAQPLLDKIVQSGGAYFPVYASDKSSIRKAYEKIDQMERSTINISRKSFRISIFDKFIFLAVLSLLILVPAGLIIEFFFVDYP
ncbi:MAG: hypothetical protein A3B99_02150 [Candidatus Yanofskybacteria bacterium RIFCSPHIGHO2_02_FULL_44_12b]|uniref:VWFA domain-containing protein n=2 Tax=Candidatus Yanofskyibacteriota TaxID=1752733 RepID=A0A1F8GNH3_9BACT|nr:MAG: hypothetical protein A2659_04225 [Candidatus Yanofskybacteria bacterium RIFCSPHIGHO2_01_FULL_44_24]OGN15260.1 MAG: hypothetical protein A3B99_02150 [Candidatus Yanofskybacteria bacterium RIFCSPHIGHO2_02_FULL_44_12b]OGN26923.1 MAG: hypothetical protein A2925_01485 [Candidatus Yanofskybacteria bacterium RIFCSPLOWO2_01_FULL_44_22]